MYRRAKIEIINSYLKIDEYNWVKTQFHIIIYIKWCYHHYYFQTQNKSSFIRSSCYIKLRGRVGILRSLVENIGVLKGVAYMMTRHSIRVYAYMVP